MATTHFPNGLTTTTKFSVYGEYILPDPSTTHTYFEDFNSFTAAEWNITTIGSGSRILGNTDGGILGLVNGSADANSTAFRKDGESFLFEVGKKSWFKSRILVETSLSIWIAGLQIDTATPKTATHGVFISSEEGTSDIVLTVIGSVGSSSVTLTTEDFSFTAGFFTVAFFYDGKNLITGYINDIALGSLTAENLPVDEVLTISFFIENEQAAQEFIEIDYILSSKER